MLKSIKAHYCATLSQPKVTISSKKMPSKKKIFASLFFATSMALAGCSQQTEKASETKAEPAQASEVTTQAQAGNEATKKTYLATTILSFPPFVMRDEQGEARGFDMDILNAIAEKEGFAVKFLVQPWADVLPSVANGTRDIAATGVVITPERQALYDFSDPYLDTGWMMLMKEKEGEEKYTSFEQLLSNPKTVFTTEAGAAGVPELKRLLNGRKNEVIEAKSQFLEIKDVLTGKADVAFDIDRVLQYYAKNYSDKGLYGITDPNAEKDHFGFVVQKGRDDDLLEKVNSGLVKIKADGTYQKIYEKWFGKAE